MKMWDNATVVNELSICNFPISVCVCVCAYIFLGNEGKKDSFPFMYANHSIHPDIKVGEEKIFS